MNNTAPGVKRASIEDDAPDALTVMHQLEAAIDVLEPQGVGDHRIDLQLAGHVPVDDLRHVGAATGAAEGRAHPFAAGDELERPGGDLLPGARDADDHRLAPA